MADAKAKSEVKDSKETVVVTTPTQPTVEKKAEPVKKKDLDRNMMVSCRSIVQGELTYVSRKTGLETSWANFGDEEYIDLGELMTMKAGQPKFLNNPWIMIDDQDVVEYLGLKAMYDKIVAVDQLDEFFYKQVDEMIEILKKAPKGTRKLIADTARVKVEDGSLDSMRIIKALENELTIDLSMVQ
jgi:hypothetical protein